MPCLPEIGSLVTRNVNASKATTFNLDTNQDGFSLDTPDVLASCEQVNDPFAVFCNIPQPADNDGLATMCNLAQETDNPNSFFQKLVRGQNTNLEDMAIIWESARLDSPEPWIPIPNSSLHTRLDNSDYLGLNLFNVQSLSVTDNAQSLIAVRNGWVVESNRDGLIHPAIAANEQDQKTTISFLRGPNTANQFVQTSPKGFVRCALFSNAFYFYGNGAWLPNLSSSLTNQSNVEYQALKMWIVSTSNKLRVAVFYAFDSAITNRRAWNVAIFEFFDLPSNQPQSYTTSVASITSLANQEPFYMGFLGIQPNNDYLIWSTMPNLGSASDPPSVMNIHVCNVHNNTSNVYYNVAEINQSEPFLSSSVSGFYYNSMLASGAIDPQNRNQVVTILFVMQKNMFQASFSMSGLKTFQVIQRASRALCLSESIDHSRMMFVLDGTLRVSCSLQQLTIPGQTFALDDDNLQDAYVFALSPTQGTDIWIIRNTKLYRLHNTNPSPSVWGYVWLVDFPLYFAQQARVSDFGLPTLDRDVYVPAVSSRWYMGVITLAQDPNPGGATHFPYEVARSAHQTFRFVVTSVRTTAGDLQTFPFAVGQLQRANEYILAHQSFDVKVNNDSNVVFEFSDPVNNWQSNTHDRVSVQEGSAIVSNLKQEPFAIASNNGLYLLYTVPERRRLRLIFNPFNASRMTQWCATDIDRFNQALQIQHDVCWTNMKIPNNDLFVDSRCTCIGGRALFDIVVPGTDLQSRSLTAPLAESLPCFTETCNSGTNGISETPTNVSRFVSGRCTDRILNITRQLATIQRGDLTKNAGYEVYNSAGLNRGQCSQNEQPCDFGSKCVNGRCIATCSSNAQCQQLYGLANSTCVNQLCTPVTPPAHVVVEWWVYLAIVCAVLVIVCILVFVALNTKQHKKQS